MHEGQPAVPMSAVILLRLIRTHVHYAADSVFLPPDSNFPSLPSCVRKSAKRLHVANNPAAGGSYSATTHSSGNAQFSNVATGQCKVAVSGSGIPSYSYTYNVPIRADATTRFLGETRQLILRFSVRPPRLLPDRSLDWYIAAGSPLCGSEGSRCRGGNDIPYAR